MLNDKLPCYSASALTTRAGDATEDTRTSTRCRYRSGTTEYSALNIQIRGQANMILHISFVGCRN